MNLPQRSEHSMAICCMHMKVVKLIINYFYFYFFWRKLEFTKTKPKEHQLEERKPTILVHLKTRLQNHINGQSKPN